MADQQPLELLGVEPEAWQLVGIFALGLIVEIPTAFPVVFHGRAEAVAQMPDGPGHRRPGAFQFFHEGVHGDGRPSVMQGVVQLVDAVEVIHVQLPP